MAGENLTRHPFLQAMQSYLDEGAAPFHTPGHKMGRGAPAALQELLGPRALAMDLTTLPGLGDLFDKAGPIQQSQRLAAELYGADATYFLVNGTTGGVYAMMLATLGPGDKVLLPRNVHRSVLGGLILSGAVPEFINPVLDSRLQVAMNVTAEAMTAAIESHPDAKAVVLVNPTYYGAATDVGRIVETAHAHGLPVLVDEAHGPHLHFSAALPLSALDAGADIVVQSTHKLLGSLSQTSLLHCRRGRISPQRLETMLQLVQSSSPNYLLLASLEAAMAQMAEAGELLVGHSVALAEAARARINQIPGLVCFGREKVGDPGVFAFDATKLTVSMGGIGLTGNAAAAMLRREGGVQAEMADGRNVLFLVTLGDDATSLDRLVDALAGLQPGNGGAAAAAELPLPPLAGAQLLSPREALFSRNARLDFRTVSGRICAETVVSYPPGIPLLMPGERITAEMIAYCLAVRDQGFTILGPEDPTLQTIGVVA